MCGGVMMVVNCTTNPPALCLFQAPASTQKTKKKRETGPAICWSHFPERCIGARSKKKKNEWHDKNPPTLCLFWQAPASTQKIGPVA